MRLTSKGQVTIPLAEVIFEAADGGVLIRPARDQRLKSLRSALPRRARGSADAVLSTSELMRITRGED